MRHALTLALAISFFLNAPAFADLEGRVKRIVDGDTVHVTLADGEVVKVRLVNIDSPESYYMRERQDPWGRLAKRHLEGLIPRGTRVTLRTPSPALDRYGRTLALIFRGGRNINLEMVRAGWAVTYLVYPAMGMIDEFMEAQASAIAGKRGIFNPAPGTVELPYLWRRRVSGRAPYWWVGGARSRTFLPPGSESAYPIEERVFFSSSAEARAAGYAPRNGE